MQIAVIEFGSSKIVTVVASSAGFDQYSIKGSGTVQYAGYSDDGWNDPDNIEEAVASSISKAELEAKTQITSVYVGVPGPYITCRTVEAEIDIGHGKNANGETTDMVTEDDIDAVQDAAAAKLNLEASGDFLLHRAPAWFSVDDGKQNMEPVGKHGSRLRAQISFVTANADYIDFLREFMGSLGYTVAGFFAPTYGLGLLATRINERNNPTLFIDVGFLYTSVTLFMGDAITFHQSFNDGAGFMAGALMDAFELTQDEAEQIKRQYTLTHDDEFDPNEYKATDEEGKTITIPYKQVKRAIEPEIEILVDHIREVYEHSVRNMLFNRSEIYLTGGGLALMRGAKERLSGIFGKPVKLVNMHPNKLKGPMYHSVQGLVDLVMNALETDEEPKRGTKQFMTGFFNKGSKNKK